MMAEDIDKLIERLDAAAVIASDVSRMMADDKSTRNGETPGTYMHARPDQTLNGEAATALRAQQTRVSELEAEREKLLTRCLQVEENEAALIADRGALAEALTDMVRYYDGTDEMQEELQADFSGPDGLVPDAEVRRLVLANARNALARVMFEAARSDTGPQAQVRAETGVPVAPDGWQLVPKEPAWEVLIDHGLDSDTWAALLAALPTPPAAEAVGGGGLVLLPKEATHSMAAYARHRNPGISIGLAMGIWSCMSDQALLEMQRERGDVAGQDGLGGNCALKGTGPAASTVSDDLVTEIAEVIRPLVREYAIEGAYPNPPAIARAVLSSPPVREIVEVLEHITELFSDLKPLGEDTKNECAVVQARSILSRFQSVGGDDVDASSLSSSEAALRAQEGE